MEVQTKNGLHADRLTGRVEFYRPREGAVIGEGQCTHLATGGRLGKFGWHGYPFEKGVGRVKMKVDESHIAVDGSKAAGCPIIVGINRRYNFLYDHRTGFQHAMRHGAAMFFRGSSR